MRRTILALVLLSMFILLGCGSDEALRAARDESLNSAGGEASADTGKTDVMTAPAVTTGMGGDATSRLSRADFSEQDTVTQAGESFIGVAARVSSIDPAEAAAKMIAESGSLQALRALVESMQAAGAPPTEIKLFTDQIAAEEQSIRDFAATLAAAGGGFPGLERVTNNFTVIKIGGNQPPSDNAASAIGAAFTGVVGAQNDDETAADGQ